MKRLLVGLLVLVLVSPATVWGWVREHGNFEKVVMLKPNEGFVIVVSNHSSFEEVTLRAERLAEGVCANLSWEDGDSFSLNGLTGAWGIFKCPSLPSGEEKAQEWALKYYTGQGLIDSGLAREDNDDSWVNSILGIKIYNETNNSRR